MNPLVLKNLKKGLIFISGDITEDTYLAFANKIRYIPENVKEITIMLHTDGGLVDSAMAIIDEMSLLQNRGKIINTVGAGKCLSAGTLILVYGNHRFGMDNTSFMIHHLSYGMEDAPHQVNRSYVEFADKVHKSLMSSMAVRCGRTKPQEIKDFINKTAHDLWLNCDEAIEFGLIEGKWVG